MGMFFAARGFLVAAGFLARALIFMARTVAGVTRGDKLVDVDVEAEAGGGARGE